MKPSAPPAAAARQHAQRSPAGQMGQRARGGSGYPFRNEGQPGMTGGYWRAMAMRASPSVSVIRSPDRSTVTVRRMPVNRNGDR